MQVSNADLAQQLGLSGLGPAIREIANCEYEDRYTQETMQDILFSMVDLFEHLGVELPEPDASL